MKKSESFGVWLTSEQKEKWKKLASQNNMTLSSFTSHTIQELLSNRVIRNKDEVSFTVGNSIDEVRSPVLVRLSKSELEVLRNLGEKRGQSRQEIIVAAIRQFLLKKLQIDLNSKQALLDSTLELNKVGVNLNQIARVLNTQAKVGDIKEEEIRSALQAISVIDDHISSHIKTVDNFLKEHSRRNQLIVQN